MRNFQSTMDLFAVSANAKETAYNAEQTLDTGMLVDRAQTVKVDRRSETNIDEALGKEEPDAIYNLGGVSSVEFAFSKAQAQHAGFLLAYGLGVDTPAAWGGGWKHAITPINGDLDEIRSNPSFTFANRYGKRLLTERWAGGVVDQVVVGFKKDSWLSVVGSLKGSGKRTSNFTRESVAGFCDDVLITLAANAVDGITGPERIDNVHRIEYQKPTTLEWVTVVFSAVTAGPPSAITITAPNGGHVATTFRVYYNIKADGTYAWAVFPNRVSEPPLRCTDLQVIIGGKWNGSVFLGGKIISADINSFEWTLGNNITPEFVPGGTGTYANRAIRDGRTQKISFDRKFKDYILGYLADQQESFGLYAKATGAEFEAGKPYYVEMVFPKVGILTQGIAEDGKRLGEKSEFVIFEDDTYGSVLVTVANMVPAYAA
jgi:hypothetical protein